MLHRHHQTAFLLFLSTALSVSAQMFPATHDISKIHFDTLKDGTTVEYVKEDSTGIAELDPNKPRARLSHPVALGLGAFIIGPFLALPGALMADETGYKGSKNSNYHPVIGIPLLISGITLFIGGPIYAIVGSIYNANLPPDDAGKKAAAQHYGFTPELSFSKNGKPQPGMMTWVSF